MRCLAASKYFQKQLKALSTQDREKVNRVLKLLLQGLGSGEMSAGLGFKKINCDKYEIRVDIRNRIVMKADGDTLICHLIGNHEAVKRFLREFRNK